MSGSQHELCVWRLAQGRDSLLEARVLQEAGMSRRSVVNRLYYAMFYAVLALLQTKQLGTSKHSGVIALFDREFVKTGQVPREFSKVLHRAFELRQKGDLYGGSRDRFGRCGGNSTAGRSFRPNGGRRCRQVLMGLTVCGLGGMDLNR